MKECFLLFMEYAYSSDDVIAAFGKKEKLIEFADKYIEEKNGWNLIEIADDGDEGRFIIDSDDVNFWFRKVRFIS